MFRVLRRISHPALTLLLLMTAAAACHSQDVAFRRAARLNDGVNLSGWLTWGDNSEQRFKTYTTAQDLKLIHDLGFHNVRLGFDPAGYQRLPVRGPRRAAALEPLHRAVDLVLESGLDVTICVFPNDSYKQDLFTGDNKVEDFVRLWHDLAASFAGTDPDRVFFEIMNEPEQSDIYRWVGIESRVVQAIRGPAPNHTVIAAGAHYSGLEDLLRTEPVGDSNVIYNFHFYEPFLFTHQGATWTASEVLDLKDVPYPSDQAAIEPLLAGQTNDYVKLHLYNYGTERWDEATITRRIAFAADWGREHHVPVICNEFGAFKTVVAPAARARYLHDVRSAMEANHIPWATWDYRGDFGVVDRSDTRIQPDDLILGALGMKTGVAAVELKSTPSAPNP